MSEPDFDYEKAPRIFVDTQVFSLFRFLERPDDFRPVGQERGRYVVTTPIVFELEEIKDEHFSSGQRSRARKVLDLLEQAKRHLGQPRLRTSISENCCLEYYWPEPSEANLNGHLLRIHGPDERFIAAIAHATSGGEGFYVLSDDVGVRVRAKHVFNECLDAYRPDKDLRYAVEEFNLPQLVKASVRELARELATSLRDMEHEPEQDKS